MIAFNEKELGNDTAPQNLFVNDIECSPSVLDILKGFFLPFFYPTSLFENNKKYVYPTLMSTMEQRWSKFHSGSFNIIMVDFIERGVIQWIITENSHTSRLSG